jgi:hypothetical protein
MGFLPEILYHGDQETFTGPFAEEGQEEEVTDCDALGGDDEEVGLELREIC